MATDKLLALADTITLFAGPAPSGGTNETRSRTSNSLFFYASLELLLRPIRVFRAQLCENLVRELDGIFHRLLNDRLPFLGGPLWMFHCNCSVERSTLLHDPVFIGLLRTYYGLGGLLGMRSSYWVVVMNACLKDEKMWTGHALPQVIWKVWDWHLLDNIEGRAWPFPKDKRKRSKGRKKKFFLSSELL